ncbi:MAG TPA: hypothetical protein VK892_08585, partial [Pyrinomonadaceae bacterium]|nr:hypothetical protein [Pyrinomonadaceae bacterium]
VDLAIGSIAFAPSNPSIVYAGMGDKSSGYMGTGVLKSTDAGKTWTRVSSNLPAPGRISKIEVDPTNPNRVYVAQFTSRAGNIALPSGFWYSTDGGVNWTKTLAGSTRDLAIHPTQPNTLYLALTKVEENPVSAGGVFKSIDGGQTWARIYTSFTNPTNMKVAVTPASPQSVYVLDGSTPNGGQLAVSSDGGTTWIPRPATIDMGQFSYNCYLYVHPTSPNTIFIGTRDLWRSTDGGVTYTNITKNFTLTGSYTPTQSVSHPDQHDLYISPSNPNLMYFANDGGLWKSTDGAATFQTLNATLGLTMFTSIEMHPTNRRLTYGGTQDNGTQKRVAGQGWIEFAGGDGGQAVIDPLDPSIVFTTYVYNTVFRYSNNGDAFGGTIGNNTVFSNDRVGFYPPFVGNGVDSTLYFGTFRLWKSANRGANWTAASGTQDLTNGGGDVLSAIGVGRSNTNIIYTGSAQGRAMVSINGGTSWTNVSAGLPVRFIKSIIVSPTDSNTAYLTVSGFDSGHVFKTTNAGASWTDISGNLPNIPTNTLLIDPRNENTIYVGTDIGVFRSTNGGGNWETFNMGMPPTIVTELAANSRGLIQAATYGRGMYEINLGAPDKTFIDFDGDGRTDYSVFRPSVGEWWILRSSDTVNRAFQFGSGSDKIVPADYTGDGKTDVAFFRPSTNEWFIL